MRLAPLLLFAMFAGCFENADLLGPDQQELSQTNNAHVVVAVSDTGINPYHDIYHRPDRTDHPCTYLEGLSCDLQALELTLGLDSYDASFNADLEVWAKLRPGEVYWIPGTVFVAVTCVDSSDRDAGGICILDDQGDHGTGTTSSILSENPDASIAFVESRGDIRPLIEHQIPFDVASVSWGWTYPLPAESQALDLVSHVQGMFVHSAGNLPYSTLLDEWSGDPSTIAVGGASANGRTEEVLAAKQPDVVSYYCRPVASAVSIDGFHEACGTSFAAPTVAGALSYVILEIRKQSGYGGLVHGDVLDPLFGLSVNSLRDAMNRTSTYEPEPRYNNTGIGLPLNDGAPWVQWGWGFYDRSVAETTLTSLLDQSPADRPLGAVTYMEGVHAIKQGAQPIRQVPP